MEPLRYRRRRRRLVPYCILAGGALVALLGILVQIDHLHLVPARSNTNRANIPSAETAAPGHASSVSEAAGQRLVYPYSVIRGGVRNVHELKEAIARDRVVAAHYSKFNLARAQITELHSDKLAHVSYRIHDEFFWTKKKLKLSKGEKLITDGTRLARARCGNLVSEKPPDPPAKTSPLEPREEVFDQPTLVPISGPRVNLTSSSEQNGSPQAGAVPPGGGGSGGGVLIPPIIIIPPGGGSPPGGGGGTPIRPVPEPSSLLLISSGLVAYLVLRRAFRK